MPKKPIPEFVYVSPVEGRAVVRFPSLVFGSASPVQYIGAQRVIDPNKGRGGLAWDKDAVIAISRAEFLRFRKSYKRHLKDGDLIERTEAEFKQYLARRAAENKKNPNPEQPKEESSSPVPSKASKGAKKS